MRSSDTRNSLNVCYPMRCIIVRCLQIFKFILLNSDIMVICVFNDEMNFLNFISLNYIKLNVLVISCIVRHVIMYIMGHIHNF